LPSLSLLLFLLFWQSKINKFFIKFIL